MTTDIFLNFCLFMCVFGLFIMASYSLGIRNGQKIAKKEKVDMPNINPVRAVDKVSKEIKKHKDKKEEDYQQKLEEVNLYNIDNYNGTGVGQKNIPVR